MSNSDRIYPPTAPGKCLVPMWSGGTPAGVCGEPAYGPFIKDEEWFNAVVGRSMRHDGKYNGYPASACCPAHSGPAQYGPRVYQDGLTSQGRPMYCAVHWDFENLQESPAAFHAHPWIAVEKLLAKHPIPVTP